MKKIAAAVMGGILLTTMATMSADAHAAGMCPADLSALPQSISPQARGMFEKFAIHPATPVSYSDAEIAKLAPDVKYWDQRNVALAAMLKKMGFAPGRSDGVTLAADQIGGVPVLRITPRNARQDGKILIYVHGGAYTFFSARSATGLPALLSRADGRAVISVDYTLAPRAHAMQTTGQIEQVYRALLAAGHKASDIALFGDSAGGGLVAASVVRMHDDKLPMPAALVLFSPWADLTATGDSQITLRCSDPILNEPDLKLSAAAYAGRDDLRNPYYSPIYAKYDPSFPPTLIQVGTREILLSDSVRLYQAMQHGGAHAVLDVYEGMIHVFPPILAGTPESDTALGRASAFIDQALK